MSVLVTGGKGFIGARLIAKLVERGEEVVCFDLKTTPGRLGALAEKITMVQGDITSYNDILNTIKKYNVTKIAHLVFFSAEDRGVNTKLSQGDLYKEMMIMNTGTFNVFEAACASGIKRVFFPSSILYHGVPWTGTKPVDESTPSTANTLYGIGKYLCEKLAHEYNTRFNMEIITGRVVTVYGPGVKIAAFGANLIATQGGIGNPIDYPASPKQTLVLVHVDDIAEIIQKILFASKLEHDLYELGGHRVTYAELATIGRKLIPDMKISFNEKAPVFDFPEINNSRMKKEIGIEHRSLLDGFFELTNISRKDAGLPPIVL
jgi:UDP-glucose 4-epimerase